MRDERLSGLPGENGDLMAGKFGSLFAEPQIDDYSAPSPGAGIVQQPPANGTYDPQNAVNINPGLGGSHAPMAQPGSPNWTTQNAMNMYQQGRSALGMAPGNAMAPAETPASPATQPTGNAVSYNYSLPDYLLPGYAGSATDIARRSGYVGQSSTYPWGSKLSPEEWLAQNPGARPGHAFDIWKHSVGDPSLLPKGRQGNTGAGALAGGSQTHNFNNMGGVGGPSSPFGSGGSQLQALLPLLLLLSGGQFNPASLGLGGRQSPLYSKGRSALGYTRWQPNNVMQY